MEFKDYYSILGVDPEADVKAVKTAYRRLARKYHPDVSSESDAESRFKEIAEAYEVLSDEKKRAEYDQLRQYGRGGRFEPPPGWQGQRGAGGASAAGMDFSDFFSSIFGGRFDGGGAEARGQHSSEDFFSTRGRDLETEMPVFLEDTLQEQTKTIDYALPRYDEHGRVEETRKTLKVKIPAGVSDGERIRLKGQGAPGFGKGSPGDLYLRIRLVPHPLFDVLGRDLSITVPVAPWEAALGTRINIPTLDGRIQVTVAAGSQSGQRLRIRGKGLRRGDRQGDLYAVLKVVMPDTISEEEKRLWQQMADSTDFDPRSNWEGKP